MGKTHDFRALFVISSILFYIRMPAICDSGDVKFFAFQSHHENKGAISTMKKWSWCIVKLKHISIDLWEFTSCFAYITYLMSIYYSDILKMRLNLDSENAICIYIISVRKNRFSKLKKKKREWGCPLYILLFISSINLLFKYT